MGAKIGAGGVNIDIQSGSELIVSNNLFYGDIATAFQTLDDHKVILEDPLFTNPVSDGGDIDNFNIQENSPVKNAGLMFSQPSFPMAGTGIFSEVTEFPLKDIYGVAIDIENHNPNIGASNAYNSQVLGLKPNTLKERIFNIYPNPVKQDLNIELLKNMNTGNITIYDIQGRTVYKTSSRVDNKNIKVNLPSTIKNGIYMIKVSDGTVNQTSQFILYR